MINCKIFFFCLIQFAHLIYSLNQDGNNVCVRFEKVNKTERVLTHKPVVRYTFCLPFFRCKSKKPAYKTGFVSKNVLVNKKVLYCCDGYREESGECKPICKRCVNGICIAPETCECSTGNGGPHCDQKCPSHKFGIDCSIDCTCLLDKNCSNLTSTCLCNEPNLNNTDCRNFCKCKLDYCSPDFVGKGCENKCPKGFYGKFCTETCKCNSTNSIDCSHMNGYCTCKPGFKGEFCDNFCEDGLYGQNCQEICNCKNDNYVCDPEIGCKCKFNVKQNEECLDKFYSDQIKSSNSGDSVTEERFRLFSLFIIIAIISISVLYIMKYKRQYKEVKKNLKSYVIYSTSGNLNDEFSNPVYSYANTNDKSIVKLNIPDTISILKLQNVNHLTNANNTKNGYINHLDDLAVANFLEKNLLADATNPNLRLSEENVSNIYSTIDDVKTVDIDCPVNVSTNEQGAKNNESIDLDTVVSLNQNSYDSDEQIKHYDQPKSSHIDLSQHSNPIYEIFSLNKELNSNQTQFQDKECKYYDRPKLSNSPNSSIKSSISSAKCTQTFLDETSLKIHQQMHEKE